MGPQCWWPPPLDTNPFGIHSGESAFGGLGWIPASVGMTMNENEGEFEIRPYDGWPGGPQKANRRPGGRLFAVDQVPRGEPGRLLLDGSV